MNYPIALYLALDGRKMSRESWPPKQYIFVSKAFIDTPISGCKNKNIPLLCMVKPNGTLDVYIATNEDVFSENWEEYCD